MDTANNKGQILLEVSVVMLLIALIAFAATFELSKGQKHYQEYQFNSEAKNGKKYSAPFKK